MDQSFQAFDWPGEVEPNLLVEVKRLAVHFRSATWQDKRYGFQLQFAKIVLRCVWNLAHLGREW
jgi:hypothetical protein